MVRASKWTDEKVKALRLSPGKKEQRKLVLPGLYLHIRARTGGELSKHWQYRAQVDGIRRWLSLGSYPEVGLSKAHDELRQLEKAREASKKGDGDHPVIEARLQRRANKAQPTTTQVFEEWIADKRMGSSRKRGEPVRGRTIEILTGNFDADIRNRLGDAKVAMLTRPALQDCIDAVRARKAPGAAAHVYRTLRGLLNFAIRRGYIVGADPMRGIENPRPYKPQPPNAANDAELRVLLAALDESQLWPATRLAIEAHLLTGARPTEVRLALWSEIDSKRALWSIPAERVKSGRAFRIHLSAEAMAVIEQAAEVRTAVRKDGKPSGNDYVFPGANGKSLEKMAVARALSRIAIRTARAGGRKLSPHDLRKTFRTMLSRLGVMPHIAELCMNHQETETLRRVYDGHDYFPDMVQAWDKAGTHLASLRSGGAHVFKLRSPRKAA